MRQIPGLTLLAALALIPVAGAALARTDYASQCLRELGAKGQYTYKAGTTAPVVRPAEGGTQAEADQINACIRSRAYGNPSAGAMQSPVQESAGAPVGTVKADKPRYTKKQRGASVLSGGAGYHGSYLEGGSGQRYADPEPARPAKKRKKAPRGLMNLPSGYALMPGDEDLWYSLTLAQQKRAIEFLQDGSTIRSSLLPDR